MGPLLLILINVDKSFQRMTVCGNQAFFYSFCSVEKNSLSLGTERGLKLGGININKNKNKNTKPLFINYNAMIYEKGT